jgi:hypothetical protein
MTTTPEQVEAVARAMWLSQYPSLTWELDANSTAKIEFRVLASAAISAMRPFIRAEALEEAAKVANEREEERVGIPCPDGIKGCAVFHFRRETRPRNHIEIIAAIRALKDI